MLAAAQNRGPMVSVSSQSCRGLFLGAMLCVTSVAHAAGPSLKSPVLLEAVEPEYPAAALAQSLEAEVVLLLTIDVQGVVTEASVVSSAGEAFDQAAQAAALRLKFAPAQRDGQPIASRIKYRMTFTPPPVDAGANGGSLDGGAPQVQSAPAAASQPATGPDRSAPGAPGAPRAAPMKPTEVTVKGTKTETQRLRDSSEAVHVVDMSQARKENADLGEVMARTQGVSLRRSGGLGSMSRLSLGGLTGSQVRFFIDGVPLAAGSAFGIANIPVTGLERIEIYRGVVPIRFGADALGGAVNLVTGGSRYLTGAAASYQIGSFGTHRLALAGRYRHRPSGFVAGASTSVDLAKNDYPIQVQLADLSGRLTDATVTRFHDAYTAAGTGLELGFVDRPWARRLLLTPFYSYAAKELQHNPLMTVPYGEASHDAQTYGARLRYEQSLGESWDLSLLANYAFRQLHFSDRSQWVYDWNGERIRERTVPGEVRLGGLDFRYWEHSIFGRANLEWKLRPEHVLRANVTPSFATRRERNDMLKELTGQESLVPQRDLLRVVGGLEYELNALPLRDRRRPTANPDDYRVKNTAFAKAYFYDAQSEQLLFDGDLTPLSRQLWTFGAGDSARLMLASWLVAKASYEYAVRLPAPEEVFGDGVQIGPSLGLEPEVSHNANLSLSAELRRAWWGALTAEVNGFFRDSKNLIALLGSEAALVHENVLGARTLGVETALGYVAPGRWVSLEGTFTYQDQRNTSTEGKFSDYTGDRIPNRPYLFGSWGIRGRIPGLPKADDTLEPFYVGRYVHQFYRSWESQGLVEFKQVVDAQVTHALGVTYNFSSAWGRLGISFEVQNLLDAAVFDTYGVQRPGRSFSLKVTGAV